MLLSEGFGGFMDEYRAFKPGPDEYSLVRGLSGMFCFLVRPSDRANLRTFFFFPLYNSTSIIQGRTHQLYNGQPCF